MSDLTIHKAGGSKKAEPFDPFSILYEANATLIVPYDGLYRITAIGSGISGYSNLSSHYDGGCGGGGYIELELMAGEQLSIQVGTQASVTGIIQTVAGSAQTSGSVTGTNVIPFSSNSKSTKSIVPPDCYNQGRFISMGGPGGDRTSGYDYVKNNGNPGGSGLFGGDGGKGGFGGFWYNSSSSSRSALGAGEPGGFGAGTGGTGTLQGSQSSTSSGHGGGGGGGGFGGGGGRGSYYEYYLNFDRETHGNPGTGGRACVFIERIG